MTFDLRKSLKNFYQSIFKSDEENTEEMISYEVVYVPNEKDAHGEWMSEDTIAAGCENFNKNLKAGVVKSNLFHMQETDQFVIEDTWINKELDVKVIGSDQTIPKGTWVAKVKYKDPDLWALRKANIINGVSIGGQGRVNEETGEITDLTFDGDS